MDTRNPTKWQTQDDFIAGRRRDHGRDSIFLDGLVIGASVASLVFAGGFALVLFCL